MNNIIVKTLLTSALTALLATGCDGGHNTDTPAPNNEVLNFNQWVKDVAFVQPEAAEPLQAQDLQFSFAGNDDEQAFVALIPAELLPTD